MVRLAGVNYQLWLYWTQFLLTPAMSHLEALSLIEFDSLAAYIILFHLFCLVDKLTVNSLQARIFVSQQPAIAQSQQNMTIVKRTISYTIYSRAWVYEGQDLQLLDFLRLQVEHHDALLNFTFILILLSCDVAKQDNFWDIELWSLLAERLREFVPSTSPFEDWNQDIVQWDELNVGAKLVLEDLADVKPVNFAPG